MIFPNSKVKKEKMYDILDYIGFVKDNFDDGNVLSIYMLVVLAAIEFLI